MTKLLWYIFLTYLLFAMLPVKAQSTGTALNKRIILHVREVPLKEVLKKITVETGIDFSYSDDIVSLPGKITLDADRPVKEILELILSGYSTTYTIVGNQVVFIPVRSKNHTITVNGYVSNFKSSERLIGCLVLDSLTHVSTSTNVFGYFNLTMKEGKHRLCFRYLGYNPQSIELNIGKDTSLNIRLTENSMTLQTVEVTNSMYQSNISGMQTGTMTLKNKDIKKVPFLLGEPDVMRAVQIMPGIQAANERSTGISVRGGSIDQNLYLIDDAPVFQMSHIMGFYSVFNTEAVKNIKIYKGDIPVNYGGRLSSLVDVRLKDGNMQKFSCSGGIGMVTSDLSVEGPLAKNKVSFIISGKYSYLGLLYKKFNSNIDLSFFDLNIKLNAIINQKNRVYFSSYIGGDQNLGSKYNNKTLSLRWNHLFNPRLFSNTSLIFSDYYYISGINTSYNWRSGMKAITLKSEFNYLLNERNTLDFGISSTYNQFIPGILEGNQTIIANLKQMTPFSNRLIDQQNVLEHAVYLSNQQILTPRLSIRYGFRSSLYQVLGGHYVYQLKDYQVTDSFYAAKNNIYAHYYSLEPRIGFNYRISSNSSIKASYTYSTQQNQLITRTNGGGPLDVWFPSDNNFKPQNSSQFGIGYVFTKNQIQANLEVYYKKMNHIIDYKDGATFLTRYSTEYVNKSTYNFEEQLRTGKGYSYGAELELKGDFKRINGFINYTYARSKRQIDGINNGKTYLSPFDHPHTFNVFINLNLTKRKSLSCNYRLQSGQVTTIPIYMATFMGKTIKGYSNRNEYRLPDYSRLDLSLTVRSKPTRHNQGEWNFSIINLLDHANFQSVDFIPSETNPNIIEAKGIYMIGLLPSVSYRFNF